MSLLIERGTVKSRVVISRTSHFSVYDLSILTGDKDTDQLDRHIVTQYSSAVVRNVFITEANFRV